QREPFELTGAHTNSYGGETRLVRGVLKLNKHAGAIAIPGNLILGGSAADNSGDGVVWNENGQIVSSATITLEGDQPSFLDLHGHEVTLSKVILSKKAVIHLGEEGSLRIQQLFVDGQRLADGVYTAPHSWLDGSGSVTIDSRVDVQGVYGSLAAIGQGNIAN